MAGKKRKMTEAKLRKCKYQCGWQCGKQPKGCPFTFQTRQAFSQCPDNPIEFRGTMLDVHEAAQEAGQKGNQNYWCGPPRAVGYAYAPYRLYRRRPMYAYTEQPPYFF